MKGVITLLILIIYPGLSYSVEPGTVWNSITTELRDTLTSILVGPKWEISMKSYAEINSLYRGREMSQLFLTDPSAAGYDVSIRCNPVPKIRFSINQQTRPYTTSKTSTRSFGNDTFSFETQYQATNELQLKAAVGQNRYEYGPGYQEFDPFLGIVGGVGYGFADVYSQLADKFTTGLNYKSKSVQLSLNIEMQQRSYLYPPVSDTIVSKVNQANKWTFYGNTNLNLKLNPKLQTNFSVNLKPDEVIGYYTSEGYAELRYATNSLNLTTKYDFNPAISVEFGYDYNINESGETYGAGTSSFGIGADNRITEKSVYYVKMDFKP